MNNTTTNVTSSTKIWMQSDAERYFWFSYHIFVLLSSLIGDTLILAASFHKDAFKVNTSILITIQHIAVCDLAMALFVVLPGAVSLLANSWVLGNGMCYNSVIMAQLLGAAGPYLVVLMTFRKLFQLKYPLCSWSNKKSHLVCGVIWIYAIVITVTGIFVYDYTPLFNYITYNCNPVLKSRNSSTDFRGYLLLAQNVFVNVSPILMIIATTIPTIKYLMEAMRAAKRVQGDRPWRGALTVGLTAFIYCISNIPYAVYYLFGIFIPDLHFQLHAYKVGFYMLFLNIMSNFYIYALTIRNFRKFILVKLLMLKQKYLQISRSVKPDPGKDKNFSVNQT